MSSSLRCRLLSIAWLLLGCLALLVLETVLVSQRTLPVSSLTITILLLAALFVMLPAAVLGPGLLKRASVRRRKQLEAVFRQVKRGSFPAAPDEVFLFQRYGWWDRERRVTAAGEAVLTEGER